MLRTSHTARFETVAQPCSTTSASCDARILVVLLLASIAILGLEILHGHIDVSQRDHGPRARSMHGSCSQASSLPAISTQLPVCKPMDVITWDVARHTQPISRCSTNVGSKGGQLSLDKWGPRAAPSSRASSCVPFGVEHLFLDRAILVMTGIHRIKARRMYLLDSLRY
ncbi:uncharacterized protein BO96DRAFT_352309 [Aspergillus niger CBS 101883]|uniref:uncharacterized protein n=1 Tax=Aspergillus lacticoffeatus (strain CBS 101883) TaxID=1450533 RepID=UPI000D7FDEB4|nr:uncharacterized protein BO96DRAFT_352309 [Aspergillus niger CBS 101883]PYH50547.1 hypothetical protein BO96DRAFT_352309 [Aspergillus niger CBS 101883]